jgi:hypothetical protein
VSVVMAFGAAWASNRLVRAAPALDDAGEGA